jgi:hypothetical protein
VIEKVKTVSKINVPDHAFEYKEPITFKVKVREVEPSPAKSVDVKLEYLNSRGSWVKFKTRTVQLGYYATIRNFIFASHTNLRVRVKALPTTYSLRSKSDPVTVRAASRSADSPRRFSRQPVLAS